MKTLNYTHLEEKRAESEAGRERWKTGGSREYTGKL